MSYNFKIVFLFIILFICYSCGDSCDEKLIIPALNSTTTLDENVNAIENYLLANGLEAEKTSSGLHYIIDNPGDGSVRPELCDEVTAAYRGYLLNGEVFDESENGATFPLNGVVKGWQEGIPLFGKNGSGTLFIPSYLGYGVNGRQGTIIGPNAVLIFDIELLNF